MLFEPAHLDPEFLPLLEPFDLGHLERDPASACGLWEDLSIAYLNRAWDRFAAENGGHDVGRRFGLGTSLLDGISGPLAGFYREALTRAIEAGEPWEHAYECSSPLVERHCALRALPLRSGEDRGLLVTHALLVERPHDRTPQEAGERYRSAGGLVTQCSHCRRVRRASGPGVGQWDWVPEYLARRPERITHGLCYLCYGFYYEGPYRQT